MKSDDIVPFLTAQPPNDLGFRQGTLLAWDSSTEANTVQIAGQQFTNLPVLAVGTLAMAAGDLIGVLRYKSTYLILGRIAPAGSGALQTRAAEVDTQEPRSAITFGDLATVGPTLTDVYIGSSRQVLVMLATVIVTTGEYGVMSFEVSGASSIAASETRSAFGGAASTTADVTYAATATNTILLTADDGLNQGLNTFRCKYKSENGVNVDFQRRRIVVIPF